VGNISTLNGQVYAANPQAMTSSRTINSVVDDFVQRVYKDPKYDDASLMYNLYIPKNYDASQSYPLVVFMHDAGVVSNHPTATLTQGLGAVIWATPEDQARHACFVLAPQYDTIIADDHSQTTQAMDMTVDLVKQLLTQYSIDPNRLYNTGQSMGGMTSIAMNIKYPDMFAASLLVACQWDPAKVVPMAKDNLWIIVCEGDTKANPGMVAITQTLQQHGATVNKATWSAQSTPAQFDKAVAEMLSKDCNVHFTIFEYGSHRYTWQYAYSIQGVRDWLLSQKKK
jgi:predicted peptidase